MAFSISRLAELCLQVLPPTMLTYPNPWRPTAGNAVMPLYYGAIRPPHARPKDQHRPA